MSNRREDLLALEVSAEAARQRRTAIQIGTQVSPLLLEVYADMDAMDRGEWALPHIHYRWLGKISRDGYRQLWLDELAAREEDRAEEQRFAAEGLPPRTVELLDQVVVPVEHDTQEESLAAAS